MFSLVLVLACGPTGVADLDIEPLESELLSPEAVSSVVALSDLGMLVSSQDGLELRHPLSSQSTWVWDRPVSLMDAVQTDALGLVVATDSGLLVGHGLLGRSELDVQTGRVFKVHRAGDALVLEASEGVFAWREGELFFFDGYSGPVATAPDGSVYLRRGRVRVHFVRSGAGWAELDHERGYVDGYGVDGQGTLWTLRNGVLSRADGLAWTAPESTKFGSLEVCGEGVWVRDLSGGQWFFDTEPRARVDFSEAFGGPFLELDPSCRWIQADYQGLTRLSWARPVGLWGLEEGEQLLGDTPMVVLPTLPALVESVVLSVNGEDQDLVDDGWVLELADWPAGGTVDVVVTYQDGVSSTLQRTFEVGDAGQPTWTEDVEFIYKDHCALCHTNGTETVLADAQDWKDNIDTILTSVSSGAMPLGKTPLTGAQIATIRAWRDGGFE